MSQPQISEKGLSPGTPNAATTVNGPAKLPATSTTSTSTSTSALTSTTNAAAAMSQSKPKNSLQCSVLAGEFGPVFAASKPFGLPTKATSVLYMTRRENETWFGLSLQFPLGQDQTANEAAGFGVRHTANREHSGAVMPDDLHRITIKFPHGAYDLDIEGAPQAVFDLFPNLGKKDSGETKPLSLVRITLREGAQPTITGFGLPFANATDPEVEGWVNGNKPVVQSTTLTDMLRQRVFLLVVPATPDLTSKYIGKFPPPFSYPYGQEQTWDLGRFKELIAANNGGSFERLYTHDDNNQLLTAINQSTVQDVLWLHEAATEIAEAKFPAYFPCEEDVDLTDSKKLYLIVPMTELYRKARQQAWGRLSKQEGFKVQFFDDEDSRHPICERVNAAASFLPSAPPQNVNIFGVDAAKPSDILDRMALARAVIRGSGFYDWQTALSSEASLPDWLTGILRETVIFELQKSKFMHGFNRFAWVALADMEGSLMVEYHANSTIKLGHALSCAAKLMLTASEEEQTDWSRNEIGLVQGLISWVSKVSATEHSVIRPLPFVNLLDIEDSVYADAIIDEALPKDRSRFQSYLSCRPLGIGIVTAAAGFGKTTAAAASVLAMQAKLHKVLCSAPSNVAVCNIAARIDERTRAITERLNQTGKTRYRHRLVVRGFRIAHEARAFWNMLKDPKLGDEAAPRTIWGGVTSHWKLHLSVAQWFLAILGCPDVRPIHPDDSEAIIKLRDHVDNEPLLARLRDLAKGSITWDEYQQGQTVEAGVIEAHMGSIIEAADILCITPAASANSKEYLEWKQRLARGLVVDEAANMNRADFLCVWGNTLLPCFLFGDPMQLPPIVTTNKEKATLGYYINRFAEHGAISILDAFQASGIPVYRLTTQLRMSRGNFDIAAKVFYPGLPLEYGDLCDIAQPKFQIGCELEAFMLAKFPNLKPSPSGTLGPFFVHCPNARVFRDQTTGSKRSPDQVRIALDLIVDFIKSSNADPSRICVITPYKSNMEEIKRQHKKHDVLKGMPPVCTVDSFQGQENDIALVIMGTSQKQGPGFTTHAQRLNVTLTRHRSGLVIVGDINVVVEKGKGKSDKKALRVEGPMGESYWINPGHLRLVHDTLLENGRVAEVTSADNV
ncbi:P-loop containing nucleoside triphosphate hydrolase protein [Stachybotrys elegans]|uniref:P-loop containing nucleoside triphosphate hydrolase protein n=1 Tax=Stachybotrys elegans TaxID=80388 RepID=A0A8K0SPV9_9HYPO|nr:P-loop containing nucleoside triphosphate hydrolase protein [Stachybotrys elegans]